MMISIFHERLNRFFPYIAVSLATLYFLPYFYLGTNFPVSIFDNLDSNVVWAKLVLDNGHFLSYSNNRIPEILSGVSSLSFNYDISYLFFAFFGTYWGYVANKILMVLIAFFGMNNLLKHHIIPGSNNRMIQRYTALLFSFLPFWSFSGSVAGTPLLFFAMLELRKGNLLLTNWLFIIFYAFYSSLVLSTVFCILVFCIIQLSDLLKGRGINKAFISGILCLVSFSIISHLPLFYSFLFPNHEISHRFEFFLSQNNFIQSVNKSTHLFLFGQSHSFSAQLTMIPAILLAFIFAIKTKNPIYFKILIFVSSTSLLYGFIHWGIIRDFFEILMAKIPIQFQRFYFLHPLMWFTLLAISLGLIQSHYKHGKLIILVTFFATSIFLLKNNEFIKNRAQPSFKNFLAEEQFQQIKNTINQPLNCYKVLCVGFHPAIAHYNGFYTIDGYVPSYPLTYKHEFRKIIVGELNKDEDIRKYFDNWGSRCYAFCTSIGKSYHPGRKLTGVIRELVFDFDQIKKMKCNFIISAQRINCKDIPQLTLMNLSPFENSIYNFYVYRIK